MQGGRLPHRGITTTEEARRFYGLNLAITGSARPAGDKLEFAVSLVDALNGRDIGN